MIPKRPAHKEQHLCADKASRLGGLARVRCLRRLSAGYIAHIKVNPRRRKGAAEGEEHSSTEEFPERVYPARRWKVERTISWLSKRRSLRTRWSKKAENWLALVQLACAHILLNLAVFG
jgi:putative transposase